MKHHIVIKLHQQLANDRDVPNWLDFITDKSVIRESVNRDVDRLLSDLALQVWVTKEYRSASSEWSADEIRQGLNRTYRLILQRECVLPRDLLDRIRSLPSVESAHELEVGEADLPTPRLATPASIRGASAADLIHLRYAQAITKGDRLVGAGVLDNINPGIKWAVDNGADVINMSLGIKHVGGGLPHEDVIRYALSKNVTVVAASGNDGTAERYYPGALDGVFAIGAVDQAGSIASFTSYGANITAVAPGVQIYSSYARNTYAVASGTSQASPFVCGLVALMKSYALQLGRTLSNHDIRDVLRHTSDKVDRRLRNEHAGYGLINMADAFKLLSHQFA